MSGQIAGINFRLPVVIVVVLDDRLRPELTVFHVPRTFRNVWNFEIFRIEIFAVQCFPSPIPSLNRLVILSDLLFPGFDGLILTRFNTGG